MSRDNRKMKSKGVRVAGEATATEHPVVAPSGGGGGGSPLAKPVMTGGRLAQYEAPGYFTTPYGQTVLTARSRPIPADEVQAIGGVFAFDVKGYWVTGSASNLPTGYADASTLLADWYNYKRQQLKAELGYKHLPATLNDTSRFADYLNIGFFAIANLVTLINLNNLYQYNQALSTVYSYLPLKMSRILRLYRRAMAARLPNFIKSYAIKCGMIPYCPGKYAPHIRLWSAEPLIAYGGTVDYTAPLYASEPITGLLNTEAQLDSVVASIEAAVWVLEGNVSYDANVAADITAIRDLLDMLANVGNSGITQGLPDEKEYPGLIQKDELFNDWYYRGIRSITTTGTLMVVFPTYKNTVFNGNIPILGKGVPGEEEFTLLGGTKFFQLSSSVTGLEYASTTGLVLAAFGTTVQGNGIGSAGKVNFYTREDGWVPGITPDIDWNDGTALRTFFNSGHPMTRHVWKYHGFAGQLTTSLEYRFMKDACRDYEFWIDPDDIITNYATMIARELVIPYIK